ncbi:GNAT family N-acetyltransferase [Phytoactinopolyspora limicola]|uniref:GNAT family N-acetyltransferase n=1 Tax=Phytoactinopolyspora limicola TaxID=2715536 RepID=UPI00140849AB|nr:GNAT family N-acetyltransferase [Phytoactinopolyspora limicola]
MTVNTVATTAFHVADAAARRSGVNVRILDGLADVRGMVALFDEVWQPDSGSPLMTVEHARAMSHSGNYLAGAFIDDQPVGACIGFFAAPPGVGLHSHIAGVTGAARGRSVGFALKLHQRAWALERGLTEITWTYDPLVRRNAFFNLVKLGARPREYLVDFYGDIDDAINGGQGSDRLLVAWQLAHPAVIDSCAGDRREADVAELVAAGAVVALDVADTGGPRVTPGAAWGRADTVLVRVPPDIEALRGADPGRAREWRSAVRDVLGGLLEKGAAVTGFARSGYYVVEGISS